ncbi:MAG: hypothetical protein KGO02_18880 [Alphaproteobacteria bacterium]|nr:hypothetical protein [Alphaproteobacteria bacterium]
MQNYATEAVTIPALVLRRAATMANGMGIPAAHHLGEGFDYLSVPDVIPQFPDDDFIPARWSLAMAEDGCWVVADAGRWDFLEVHAHPSTMIHATLAEALGAIHEARTAELLAEV